MSRPLELLPRPVVTGNLVPRVLAVSLSVVIVVITYAVAGLLGFVPVTVSTVFVGIFIYSLSHSILLSNLWTQRQHLSFTWKIFGIAWAGVLIWCTLPMAVLAIITGNFDAWQLRWLNFFWLGVMPGIGSVVAGILAVVAARPMNEFIKNNRRTVAPGKLYAFTLRYPVMVSLVSVVFIIIGHGLLAWVYAVFLHLPGSEQLKIMMLGLASALFMAIFYYLSFDTFLREIRHYLETANFVKHIVTRHYARRMFVITFLVTLGSLVIVSLIVFQSFQRFIFQELQNDAVVAMSVAQRELSLLPKASDATEHVLSTLSHGQHGLVVSATPSALQEVLQPLDIASETATIIASQPTGVVTDMHRSVKVVSFFTDSVRGQKIIVVTQAGDFYGPLISGMEFFAVAGVFILLLATLVSTFANRNFSRSIQQLSLAVRLSQQKRTDFSYDTNTADELEDLAHAFRYYINHSNELQRDLERKVEERTTALIRIEEEKNMLETKSAQLVITGEQHKRQETEKINSVLEKRVKERTAELQEAVHHLKELDKVKSEFISIASHQLRTPLTTIRWSYQALLDTHVGKISLKQKKIVTAGLQKTLFMMRLVNNLLDISRIEGDRFKLEYSEVDLDDVLRQVVHEAQDMAIKKEVAVTYNEFAGSIPTVWLDQEKIQMALSNIIDNAIKYTNSGGSVAVSLTLVGGVFTVLVKDTGIGIPQDQIYRLFTKFFRSTNAISVHTDGSGLGLYIARRIVEKHGGIISVESVEGQGTTFLIRLPATRTSKKPLLQSLPA